MIQWSCIQTLNCKIGETACPETVMYGHAVDGCKAVVVGEVKDDDMKDERRMRCFDFVLRPEIKWYRILPFLKLMIELTNGIQQYAI